MVSDHTKEREREKYLVTDAELLRRLGMPEKDGRRVLGFLDAKQSGFPPKLKFMRTTTMPHDWIKSTLGHGNQMCRRCFATDLEAAAIGMTECDPPPPKAANKNVAERQTQDEIDGEFDLPFICPVTDQPCMTEQDEFCEDYGCARQAGIDVDRDIV